MSLNTNSLLILLQEKFGHLSPESSCHGFAVRWLEAYLVGEEHLFENRVKEIYSYGLSLINQTLEIQDKTEEQLAEEDKKLLDIKAFCEYMELQQDPESYTSLFGRLLTQSDVESVSDIITSDAMRSRGGLHKIYSYPAMYTKEEVKLYFDKLGDVLDSSTNTSSKERWGMIIGGFDHSVALSYTPGVGWKFMDIEQYPPLTFAKEETPSLAEEIANALIGEEPASPYIGFNTAIFTTGDNELLAKVTTALDQLNDKLVLTEDILKREYNGYDLVYLAAQNEHIWVLIESLKYGLSLNKNYDGYPLIYLATQYGNLEIIDFLCVNGIEVDTISAGYTPLFLAARNGDVACISLLAKKVADINKGNCTTGATPVYIAAKKGHPLAITALEQLGADLCLGDNDGATPLHAAAIENHVEVIVTLIKLKVSPNIADDNGVTPLHVAAKKNNLEAIKVLINLGADPNLGNDDRRTPLHMAAQRNNIEAMVLLIKLGADPSLRDDKDHTPLHAAVLMDQGEAVATLAQFGVDLNTPLDNGSSPAFIAAQYGCIDALDQIIQSGVNVHSVCEITEENLRILALHCSEKIATSEYSERIINNMEQFIKQHQCTTKKTLSITPYDIACIMEEEVLLCLFDNNPHKRKANEMDFGFFTSNESKKVKTIPESNHKTSMKPKKP
ncbi:ankyrin repeat domain-containing protein [Legionella rowbothamii]|uniref:ankyrin repeat domain-containing protein n=1 Tax=Legionella rowbothamii TaxID=96229 RepID=UPI00105437C5|nr:ankyrin repeat domain-containing protein [Legionella rowbothamii]